MRTLDYNRLLIYLLCITYVIYVYLAWLDSTYIQYSNLVFTGLLLLVTTLYTNYTKNIISETQKDRKIAHFEKQLEKLYYPLKDYINSSYIQSLKDGTVFHNREHFHAIVDSGVKWSSVAPYIHLASPRLKISLEDFIRFMRCFRESPDEYVEQKDTIEIIDNLEKVFDEDIHELKQKLNELYDSA